MSYTYEKAVHHGVGGLFIREGIRGSSSLSGGFYRFSLRTAKKCGIMEKTFTVFRSFVDCMYEGSYDPIGKGGALWSVNQAQVSCMTVRS